MRSTLLLALFVAFSLAGGSTLLHAQSPQPPANVRIDDATRSAVIEQTLSQLNSRYVFPDQAQRMESAIRERQQRNEYDRLTNPHEFADSLTSHLQAVSRDKHLRVRYSEQPIPQRPAGAEPSPEARERQAAMMRANNFNFHKVEWLPGNVGYLELRGFADASLAGAEETVAAAMDFLANTDALIIDLRRNGGGSPQMVALLSSYLFGAQPVHLNSLYWRPENRTDDFWTRAEVKGTRFGPTKPVYILTSNATFSAAEEFTYNLKALQRATVVGETTGGGAHPGGMQRVHEHFAVFIPSGRAINPITRTNWEGTGVEPDIEVAREEALRTAHLAALRSIQQGSADPQHRAALEQVIQRTEARP